MNPVLSDSNASALYNSLQRLTSYRYVEERADQVEEIV